MNINEKFLSHIPAVKTLMAFGYKLLNQEKLKKERSNSQNILLDNTLIEKIKELNKTKHNFNLEDEDAKRQCVSLEILKILV